MTLADWEVKGWLQQYTTSKPEVRELLHNVESDLRDSRNNMFAAWNFSLACTAALNLCTVLLNASGYHAGEQSHHKVVQTLPLILGDDRKADADYIASCLHLRCQQNLESGSSVTPGQASELVEFVEDFYLQVVDWLPGLDSAMVVNSDVSLLSDPVCALSLVES